MCVLFTKHELSRLQDMSSPNPLAKAQLDLLSKLIGSEERSKSARTEIRLNLFNSEEEEE